MGFKFSLQKLLESRKIQEELAQRDLQEAVYQLQLQEERLTEFLTEIEVARQRSVKIQNSPGFHANTLQEIHRFIVGQDIRIQRQNEIIRVGRSLVEERREVLREAAIEYKIIDKLKEKKMKEYEEMIRQRELREMDEMSVMRFKRGVVD